MSEDKLSKSQEDYIEKIVNERLGHISSELTHDLRSPLQTIQNAIYLLEKSPDNSMLFDMIRQSLKQVTDLLDSFRDYYKSHIITPFETEIGTIIDLALSNLEIPDSIKVTRENSSHSLVKLDPTKIALAIKNLVINGIDAMPEGGELNVLASETDDSIIIKIIDTGIGIAPEYSDSVFVPFESNKKGGKGLGAPIAQRVIQSHGGSISFTSTINEGTVFTILLPKETGNL